MLWAASSTFMLWRKSIFMRASLRSMCRLRSLFVNPGTTSNTSTSNRANSARNASVKPHRANLLAEYSVQAGIPRRPHIEATLRIAGFAAAHQGWQGQTHQLRRGEEVDLHHLTQNRFGSVGEMAGAGDSRVVDQHVQAVETLIDRL